MDSNHNIIYFHSYLDSDDICQKRQASFNQKARRYTSKKEKEEEEEEEIIDLILFVNHFFF